MLTDQASSNTLAGLYSAWRNNEYPSVDVRLASNHRLLDIAPYQRITLSVTASATPRGITKALTLIPRSVTYLLNDGYMTTDINCEAEVTADLAVTGDTPIAPPDPPIIPIDPPIDPPPIDPGVGSDAREMWFAAKRSSGEVCGLYYSSDYFLGGQPSWHSVAGVPSMTDLYGMAISLDGSMAYLYGLAGGTNINTDAKIWKCANPKAATSAADWTLIADNSTALAGYTFAVGTNIESFMGTYGTTFYVFCNGYSGGGSHPFYGEYNGTTWTWLDVSTGSAGTLHQNYRIRDSLAFKVYVFPPMALLYNGESLTNGLSLNFHRFYGGNVRQVVRENASPTVWRLRNGLATDTGYLSNFTDDTISTAGATLPNLAGSYKGTRLYLSALIGSTWYLYSSLADEAFAKHGAILRGYVRDSKLLGGGALVNFQSFDKGGDAIASGSEFARISRDGTGNAGSWESMTGDFWTGVETGGITIYIKHWVMVF